MRLIDADALKDLFEQNDDLYRSQDIRHIVDNGIPTVDPVKHGHWEYDKDFFYPPKCSVCATSVKTPGYIGDEAFYQQYFKCCPACGAKMDVEVEDD